MKNTTFLLIMAILVIIVIGFFISTGEKDISGSSISDTNTDGETQKIVLSMKNNNYYPNTIRVKADLPVEISLDKTISGCYRSFTIKDFGVSKYLATPQDTVIFTPNKKGTFTFACSMGMGYGKLIVE